MLRQRIWFRGVIPGVTGTWRCREVERAVEDAAGAVVREGRGLTFVARTGAADFPAAVTGREGGAVPVLLLSEGAAVDAALLGGAADGSALVRFAISGRAVSVSRAATPAAIAAGGSARRLGCS